MEKDAFLKELERILGSSSFASKAQLRKLLEILASHCEAQATLKPARVMAELWGESSAERTSADLAVVVTRTRRALEEYYALEGKGDETVISLPRRAGDGAAGLRAQQWIVAETRGAVANEEIAEIAGTGAPRDEPQNAPEASGAMRAPARRWIWAGVGAALLLIAGSATAVIRWRARDVVPSTAALDGNTLAVVNAQGEELWRKSFPDGFSKEFYEPGLATRMWFGDLDGSGHMRVLFLYQPEVDSNGSSSTLICYSARGEERWRWTPGRALPELSAEPSVFWSTGGLAVLKPENGREARIVVVSNHEPQYPAQVALVDSRGKTISEYWHSGHLDTMIVTEAEGREQQILGFGESNGYNQATLVVLDPGHLAGASQEPARPELQIHGMGAAHERLRILFPRSDLSLATQRYNRAGTITASGETIRVSVQESESNPNGCIWYDFDRNLNLRSAYADDQFRIAHNGYYHTGDNRHAFNAVEEHEFRQVRCLAGCRGDYVATLGLNTARP